jgi:predicted ATPase
LSPGAQEVLTRAAVAGERTRLALLVELRGLSQSDLLQPIHDFLAAALLVEMPTGELSFRHALIREAVYASLLVPERQNLHRQTALAIERLCPDRQEMMIAELAYHYCDGRVGKGAGICADIC